MDLDTGATGCVGGRLVPRLLEGRRRLLPVPFLTPRLLRLRADMKVPGGAWLQFEATPREGGSRLTQMAFFGPHGLHGHLHWCALYPVHAAVFSSLVRRVAERGRALSAPPLPEAAP